MSRVRGGIDGVVLGAVRAVEGRVGAAAAAVHNRQRSTMAPAEWRGEKGGRPAMVARALVRSLYALLGTVFVAAGVSVLLLGTNLLPGAVRDHIVNAGRGDLNTLHIMQEFASLLVFVGLITFWFTWHYDQSRLFHWAMTVFWALFALAHWFDVRGPVESAVGPAINTVPFALFVLIGLLRAKARKG
jgi:hypothetical protein